MRESVDAIESALRTAQQDKAQRPGDLPSLPEIRDLLRLFAKLPSAELRQAVLALLRAVVGVP